MRTRLTQLLGIEHPILLPGMSWISKPELVAAVCEAGGLGILATGPLSVAETRESVRELRKRTDIHPIVFEMTDAIGGIAQTYDYKGNRIDIGGHRFFSNNQRVMNWWFNILPLQGAPSSDNNQHPDYHPSTAEAVLDHLPSPCSGSGNGHPTDDTRVYRKAPDPEAAGPRTIAVCRVLVTRRTPLAPIRLAAR